MPRRAPPTSRGCGGPVLISLLVLLVLWAQPLMEQLFGEGQGNLARIATSTGGDEPTIGATNAVRIAGGVLAVPPWWSRGSFVDAVPYTPYSADGVTLDPVGLRGTGVALLGLVVLAGLLGVAAWWSVRRRDRTSTVVAVVAAVAVVLALGSLTIMPIGPLGLTPHQMRWLWSIGAFCVLALVVAGAGALGRRHGPVSAPCSPRSRSWCRWRTCRRTCSRPAPTRSRSRSRWRRRSPTRCASTAPTIGSCSTRRTCATSSRTRPS